jgi:hypothetical protein
METGHEQDTKPDITLERAILKMHDILARPTIEGVN